MRIQEPRNFRKLLVAPTLLPAVISIKLSQVQFTSAAIVLESENNSFACKLPL